MLKLKALLMCLFASRSFARIDNSGQELILPPPAPPEGQLKRRSGVFGAG
jgi:hypothetical protein